MPPSRPSAATASARSLLAPRDPDRRRTPARSLTVTVPRPARSRSARRCCLQRGELAEHPVELRRRARPGWCAAAWTSGRRSGAPRSARAAARRAGRRTPRRAPCGQRLDAERADRRGDRRVGGGVAQPGRPAGVAGAGAGTARGGDQLPHGAVRRVGEVVGAESPVVSRPIVIGCWITSFSVSRSIENRGSRRSGTAARRGAAAGCSPPEPTGVAGLAAKPTCAPRPAPRRRRRRSCRRARGRTRRPWTGRGCSTPAGRPRAARRRGRRRGRGRTCATTLESTNR